MCPLKKVENERKIVVESYMNHDDIVQLPFHVRGKILA